MQFCGDVHGAQAMKVGTVDTVAKSKSSLILFLAYWLLPINEGGFSEKFNFSSWKKCLGITFFENVFQFFSSKTARITYLCIPAAARLMPS